MECVDSASNCYPFIGRDGTDDHGFGSGQPNKEAKEHGEEKMVSKPLKTPPCVRLALVQAAPQDRAARRLSLGKAKGPAGPSGA